MVRRASVAVCLTALFALAFGAALPTAAPVRLARHPDYHAGKVAFSYLGDIWTANEDGTDVHRLTDNLAREVYPRFSPDGRWIAFSSNRYGNNDVFVIAATGGAPRRLTFHTGNDDVVGWTRDSQQRDLPRRARRRRVPQRRDALPDRRRPAARRQPLPVDWGYWGSFSPDGKSLVFNRHPATWSRQHYRGSYAADLWIADLAAKTYTKLLGDEQYNRYWPMWGADDAIYFVADPLPNEKSVKPGSPDVRKSVNNIYKIPVKGGQPAQVTKHTDGSLFWPSMSSDGKVIVYEDNFGIWKLDVASGKTSEIKLDIATDEKENEVEIETVTNEVDAFDISPSGRRAVISARGQILTIATERGDITRVAPDKMASRNQSPKWSRRRQVHRLRLRSSPGRDEIWICDPEGRDAEEDHRPRQREGRARVDAGLEGAALHRRRQEALQLHRRRRQDGGRRVERRRRASARSSVSPDSKWIAFSKQDRTLRSHVYIAPIAGGEERHVSDDSLLYSENQRGLDRRRPLPRLHVVRRREQRHRVAGRHQHDDGAVGAVAARSGSRSDEPRHRQRGAGAGRRSGGAAEHRRGGGAAAAPAPEVRIDWNGLARRARQLTVPGNGDRRAHARRPKATRSR